MVKFHDPIRHVGMLQQCLRSDKRHIGFLFGAGCPVSVKDDDGTPIIPDIRGMTDTINAVVSQNDALKGALNKLMGHFEKDGVQKPTIEDMLTHARSLRAVAGNGSVRGLTSNSIDKLDDEFCNQIHALTDTQLPRRDTSYHSFAKWMDERRGGFPVEIFTTNYDLLVEQALEEQRVPYFDGFAGAREPFFDLRAIEEDLIPRRWARLWKLHGSINWFQDGGNNVYRGHVKSGKSTRRVIHPSHLKYFESRRLPYLAMMDKLRGFFARESTTLVLCGYSFGDQHINETIIQGLMSSSGSVVFALQFGEIKNYKEATRLAKLHDNLNVLAQDFAVIGGELLPWQEMDKESIPSPPLSWIDWVAQEPDDENKPYLPSFSLGDFAVFAAFLEDIAGNRSRRPEVVE